jgi:hypothetical protein
MKARFTMIDDLLAVLREYAPQIAVPSDIYLVLFTDNSGAVYAYNDRIAGYVYTFSSLSAVNLDDVRKAIEEWKAGNEHE